MAGPESPSQRTLLPVLGEPEPERSDAARNREALLEAAGRLVAQRGPACVSMEAVAAAAGVGKGTVFRRFGSRAGLMGALLNFSETAWQASVISGPPPLGPGAEPWERLVAFGRSRLETSISHAALIEAAGFPGSRSYAAASFAATHLRYLLASLGVQGDLPLLAVALMAPLEGPVLHQQLGIEQIPVERVLAGWVDLARRIVEAPHAAAPRSSPGGPVG